MLILKITASLIKISKNAFISRYAINERNPHRNTVRYILLHLYSTHSSFKLTNWAITAETAVEIRQLKAAPIILYLGISKKFKTIFTIAPEIVISGIYLVVLVL